MPLTTFIGSVIQQMAQVLGVRLTVRDGRYASREVADMILGSGKMRLPKRLNHCY